MSSDLHSRIGAEFAHLHAMLEPRKTLINRALREPPDLESIDALAALLHSFYTAIERVLLHIAKAEGVSEILQSHHGTWHSVLLRKLAEPHAGKPAVLEPSLQKQLAEYLGFRHVFRHAYVHQLQWSRMRPLIENLLPTLERFKMSVDGYLRGRSK